MFTVRSNNPEPNKQYQEFASLALAEAFARAVTKDTQFTATVAETHESLVMVAWGGVVYGKDLLNLLPVTSK